MKLTKSDFKLAFISTRIYNLLLVAGTCSLVGFYDWSPWWFILTLSMMTNVNGEAFED